MLKAESLIRVRYAETDQMGYVYHSNYLVWMEVARIEMLDRWGLPYARLEADGYLLPVLEARVRYRRPARFDDRVIVEATVKERPVVRWQIDYRIYRQGDPDYLYAIGHTEHSFVDRTGKPVRPPQSFQQRIKTLFTQK